MSSSRSLVGLIALIAVVAGLVYWLLSGKDDEAIIDGTSQSVEGTVVRPRRSPETAPASAPIFETAPVAPESQPTTETGVLRGYVRSDGGQPIAGAEVFFLPTLPRSERLGAMNLEKRYCAPVPIDRVFTSQDGSFEARVPALRTIRVQSRAPGYSLGVEPVVSTALDRPIEIVLSRVGSVAGLIVDDIGQPVADAEVAIHEQIGSQPSLPYYGFRLLRTHSDGTFDFDLAEGIGTMIFARRSPQSAGIVHVRTIAAAAERKLKLVLPRERRLTVAFDLSHGPPPIANVEIDFLVTSPYWSRTISCDPKEKTVIDHVPFSAKIGVMPRRGGVLPPSHRKKDKGPFAAFSPTQFDVPPESDAEIVCPLIAGATISGKTIDAQTKLPISGIHLRAGAMLGIDPVGTTGTAVSDADGRFLIAGFEEGRALVVVASREWCIEADPSAPGTVAASPKEIGALARAGSQAAPVQMTVGQRRTFAVQTTLDAPLADIVVPMVRTGRISGRVVDQDGRPVPFARLEAQVGVVDWLAGDADDAGRFADATTSVDGTFHLSSVFPGKDIVVKATKAQHVDGVSAPIALESGGEVRDVVLTLLPQARRTIVFRTASGNPVVGLQVMMIVPADAGPTAGKKDDAVTNSAGEANFLRIPAAPVDVSAIFANTPFDFRDRARSVRVDFRIQDRAVIEVVEVPVVRGRLVEDGGKPPSNVQIIAVDVATIGEEGTGGSSPFFGGLRPDRPSAIVAPDGGFLLRVEAGKSYRLYAVRPFRPTEDDRARGGSYVDRCATIFTLPKIGVIQAGDVGECLVREIGLRFDAQGYPDSDPDLLKLRKAFPDCLRKDWP